MVAPPEEDLAEVWDSLFGRKTAQRFVVFLIIAIASAAVGAVLAVGSSPLIVAAAVVLSIVSAVWSGRNTRRLMHGRFLSTEARGRLQRRIRAYQRVGLLVVLGLGALPQTREVVTVIFWPFAVLGLGAAGEQAINKWYFPRHPQMLATMVLSNGFDGRRRGAELRAAAERTLAPIELAREGAQHELR